MVRAGKGDDLGVAHLARRVMRSGDIAAHLAKVDEHAARRHLVARGPYRVRIESAEYLSDYLL